MDFKKTYGVVTKFDAGVVYRAMKEASVTILKETTSNLYNKVNDSYTLAASRYAQNNQDYDQIGRIVEAILSKDFTEAQEIINKYEARQIKLAGKKSPYFKYQQ